MFAIRAAEKNELVTPQDIDPNFTSQMVKMATYEVPGGTSTISELWQPNLTPYPTSNVMCVNCCRIVKTRTTYRPGPKGKNPLENRIWIVIQIYLLFLGCCLGTLSFLFGCWCLILLACSYFKWVHVKHYCPYCEYMVGEFRGQNNIMMNYDATKNHNSSDTEDN